MMQSEEHHQGDVVVYGFLEVQEVAGVIEELEVGRRSKNCQSGRISRLILLLPIDRILQSLSSMASIVSTAALDYVAWFPVLCQDDFKHSFLVLEFSECIFSFIITFVLFLSF